MLVLVIALLIFAPGYTLFRARPDASTASASLTATPAPAEIATDGVKGTPTPFPPEYLTNEEQTLGPTIAAALLVLVVVVGVLSKILRNPRDD